MQAPHSPLPRGRFQAAPLALALSLAFSPVFAQEATPPATKAEEGDGLKLDRVVLTGTSIKVSKMKQSLSISSLDGEQLSRSGATSATELLRSVPGVRSESSGGEGNANITVRGVPLSAGGSRYVQIQEDGLPVLLFGDIAFGTADQFLRADYNVERLEVLRGGSASTLVSNSPGGVINFISKTGTEKGGSVGLSLGLGRDLRRIDVDYGGSNASGTSFHIGGFNRTGEGGRPTGQTLESGGQIKANITQKFDQGWLRLNLKALDDKTPSLMPVPVTVSNGRINTINGIDPRTAFFITPGLSRDVGVDKDGNAVSSATRDGLRVKSTAIGFEGGYDLGNGLSVEDKFRKASNSGRFMALFPADNGNNGKAAFFTGTLFNTSLDSLDNSFNDLKLTKVIQQPGGKLTLVGGLFTGTQDVAQTWFWNQYNLTMSGTAAQVVDATGKPSTQPVALGWTTWGGCCTRSFNVQYTQNAPYAALAWESGALNIDASIRRDEQKAAGYTVAGNNTARTWDGASQKTVNYKVTHDSYSLGANLSLDKNTALFGRISNGVAFSADRLLYGNPLDGSVPIAVNEIDQAEAGVKWRSQGLSLFATLFNARTKESNYEVTTRNFTANRYSANGLELEAAYTLGDLRVNAGATLTDAKIKGSNDASVVGKQPRRQAKLVYQLAPTWSLGDLELGVSVVGSGKSYGDDQNTITMPAYRVVNAFASYQLNARTQLSVSANNLFNALAYTEIEGDGHAARALNGRTVRAALKFDF
ncbi:TonB-dependent receptor [Paucibacter sp. JuS9]|uniref:TonB-dependent receptor n=1 Tax=Paucibacter sp. JuS9 TaxID=3228748 RepID=UPI003757749C